MKSNIFNSIYKTSFKYIVGISLIILTCSSILLVNNTECFENKSNNKESIQYLNFTLEDIHGNQLSIKDLRDKVIFINFWATWCPPCVEELPSIIALKKRISNNKNIIFLLVEMDGNKDRISKFLRKNKFNFPVYLTKDTIPQTIYNGTLPTTVIIDKNGEIAYQSIKKNNYNHPKYFNLLNNLDKK